MSACMPHARSAGDGMPEGSSQKSSQAINGNQWQSMAINGNQLPEGSSQKSSTGVPFAVVSRKNCSSRFSHLMRQAINTVIRRNQSQSVAIHGHQVCNQA